MDKKLSHEEFIRQAIISLRTDGFKGIHSVYSGFNRAFKEYFGEDPIEITQKLAAEGKLVIRPAKGGVTLYLPEDAPRERVSADEVLKKMGLK